MESGGAAVESREGERMSTNFDRLKEIARNQAISRALGEIESAQHTFYDGESESSPLWEALETAARIIRDNW